MGDENSAATVGVETEAAVTEENSSLLTGGETAGVAEGSEEAAAAATEEGGATEEASGTDEAGAEGSQEVPDTYADFTLPEGMEVDELGLEKVTPLFKELGLTQENAQKLIDAYAEQIQAGSQKQMDDFTQLMNDWREQSANDKEFGGEKFEENVKLAKSAINKYGTPELKQLLEDHGVGNHPEMIRFMVRVGQTLKEDVPGAAGAVSNPVADRVAQLYPQS